MKFSKLLKFFWDTRYLQVWRFSPLFLFLSFASLSNRRLTIFEPPSYLGQPKITLIKINLIVLRTGYLLLQYLTSVGKVSFSKNCKYALHFFTITITLTNIKMKLCCQTKFTSIFKTHTFWKNKLLYL